MSDFLLELGKNPNARKLIQSLGLPIPMPQALRHRDGQASGLNQLLCGRVLRELQQEIAHASPRVRSLKVPSR